MSSPHEAASHGGAGPSIEPFVQMMDLPRERLFSSAEAYTTFPSSQQYKELVTATCITHLDFMRTVVGIFSIDVPKMDKVPILNRVLDLEDELRVVRFNNLVGKKITAPWE